MNNYNNKKPHKCEDNKCTMEYALFYITVSLNNRKYKKINKMKQQLLKKIQVNQHIHKHFNSCNKKNCTYNQHFNKN